MKAIHSGLHEASEVMGAEEDEDQVLHNVYDSTMSLSRIRSAMERSSKIGLRFTGRLEARRCQAYQGAPDGVVIMGFGTS